MIQTRSLEDNEARAVLYVKIGGVVRLEADFTVELNRPSVPYVAAASLSSTFIAIEEGLAGIAFEKDPVFLSVGGNIEHKMRGVTINTPILDKGSWTSPGPADVGNCLRFIFIGLRDLVLQHVARLQEDLYVRVR